MIKLHDEDLLPLREVPHLLPTRNGKRVSLDAVYRWARRGLAKGKLESVRIGGETYTSKQALERFASRLTGEPESARSPTRGSAHDDAAARLDAEGIA